MNKIFLQDVLDKSISLPVKEKYEKWYKFMKDDVTFWLKDSEKHTKEHCARVMLLSLLIAYEKDLTSEEMDMLAIASAFHDSRRQDDWLDKGHGKRAAEYYKDFCEKQRLKFYPQTYYSMYYHDQDDAIGIKEIEKKSNSDNRWVLIYKIFKDADALDRFRLGENALDVTMLRTKEAHLFINFAKELLRKS